MQILRFCNKKFLTITFTVFYLSDIFAIYGYFALILVKHAMQTIILL